VSGEHDHLVRLAAFHYLDRLADAYGDALPWSASSRGFSYQGVPIPLIGAAGIWKPRALDLPISISTSPKNPYGDTMGGGPQADLLVERLIAPGTPLWKLGRSFEAGPLFVSCGNSPRLR